MKYDSFGVAYTTSNELCDLLYQNPQLDLSRFNVVDPELFNQAVNALYAEFPTLATYESLHTDIQAFDQHNQQQWHMPDEYKNMDIAADILSLCSGEAELQRAGEELLMFQERDLFDLLKYLKYLVDTMRSNNVVWGVGRGSSVASFVLYLLGVHKINSLEYDLDPTEFLK